MARNPKETKPTEKLAAMYRSSLSPLQQKFADAYMINGDQIEAARVAGYTKPSIAAAQCLANETVKKYIDRKSVVLKNRQKEVTQSMMRVIGLDAVTVMTHTWKLEQLKKIVVAVVEDESGVNLRYASAAISAIAEANKMQGDYAPDKIEVNVKTDADILRLNSLCADMIEQKRAEIMKGLDITDFVEFKPAVLEDKSNAD